MTSFLNKLKQATEFEPKFYTKFEKDIPIYQFDLSKELDHFEVVKNILDIQKQFPESRVSSINAWHTDYSTLSKTKILDSLISIIEEKVKKIDYSRTSWKLEVYEYWAIIYKKEDYTEMHDHAGSVLSFVYYAQTFEDSAPLVFKDKLMIRPKNGMLIIFPSFLEHSVPISGSDKDRIVVAGNLYIEKDRMWENV
jgi:hypothetical protein